ncbi:hypothetical protein BDN71DRAFT_1594440 [Pleurotus eryngii]|uniref:Uncharacterized protein n=1 Tax=Pleurotus eryngii TaxID=5323 RepID=A0A9P6D0G3_PLEER|nr:hypothetical protein BDN71DRAFT_1594440 [Pleurotus eryngii]
MAPKEKVTTEQKTYLLVLIDDYLEVKKHGDLTKFWARLFLAWFKLWPVEVNMGIKDEQEQREACGLTIKAQENYLKTWFRNRTAPKTQTSHVAQELNVTKLPKATRCLQEVEIYSKKYYSTRVAHLVDNAFVGKHEPTTKELLKVRRKITQDTLNNETPGIKDEISTTHKEALHVRGEQKLAQKQKVEPTPDGIKGIEPNFQAFAERVGLDSGWLLTLIASGPDPMNAGRVKTASFHYGENVFGLIFIHEPDFKEKFLPSYANFLQTCYSPEQCSIRTLNRPSDTAPSVVNGSPSTSTPLEALSPLPDITAPPEATVPPKAAKGKATKTTKASKASTQARASKLSAEPTLPDANTTTVATTVIPTPEQVVIATLPSVADTTLTSDQGVAWESLPFPLLPPDLNYLNDPANFPNAFPIVSNVPMSTTIPSTFVVPPLGTYMSLLDKLGGPLPTNLLGAAAQINPYPAGMMPTAPPLPYPHATLSVGPNASVNGGFVYNTNDAPNTSFNVNDGFVSHTDNATNNAPNTSVNKGVLLNNAARLNTNDAPNADVSNKGVTLNTNNATNAGVSEGVTLNINNRAVLNTNDTPNGGDNDGVVSNTNNAQDASAVPEPSTRVPRKRRSDEIDPKFIVEGKRVRRQQVRTEIEALTHKGTVEKRKQFP